MPTTSMELVAEYECRACMFKRVDKDLPATALLTASAERRSFWANIVIGIMLFSNFGNVSAAQLDGLTAAESTAETLGGRVGAG